MLLELFDGCSRLFQRIHNYTCLDHASMRRQNQKPSTWMAEHMVAALRSDHNVAKALKGLYRLGCCDVSELAASQRRIGYAVALSCVRRQRVQTFSRSD